MVPVDRRMLRNALPRKFKFSDNREELKANNDHAENGKNTEAFSGDSQRQETYWSVCKPAL